MTKTRKMRLRILENVLWVSHISLTVQSPTTETHLHTSPHTRISFIIMSTESSSSTSPKIKYYRVLRLDDELYKAPGLVQRKADKRKVRDPLYFTDYAGILSYAFHWGTTYCDVKVPHGITITKQECGNIYKARLVRLGKVKPIDGEFIASILRTLHSSGELTMDIIGDLMETLGLELRLDFIQHRDLNKYQITRIDKELAPCCRAPAKPHTKYQLKTYYKLTDDDYETIINAIQSVLDVDVTVKKQKPADNAEKTS